MAIAHEEIQRQTGRPTNTSFTQEQEEREHINNILQNAFSLTEVQEAARQVRDWAARHPVQQGLLSSIFEQLALAEESAREAETEANQLGLSDQEKQQRERVFALRRRVHAEDTPAIFMPALRIAQEALEAWKKVRPSDPQIPYLHEALVTEQATHALFCHAV